MNMVRNLIQKVFSDGSTVLATWDEAPSDCNYVCFRHHGYEWLKVNDAGLSIWVNSGDYGDWDLVRSPFDVVGIMENAYERPAGV